MANAPRTPQPAPAQPPVQPPLTNEELLCVWSKAVDTQMHFNEMSVKSRQLGLAFVAAALGIAVLLLGQGDAFAIVVRGFQVHVTVLLIGAAMIALGAVRTLDLGVYHQMLRGSVAFGQDLEAVHVARLLGVNKGMTQAISLFSQSKTASTAGTPAQYTGRKDKSAGQKIARFYNQTLLFLSLASLLVLVVTNIPHKIEGGKGQEPATVPTKP